MKLKIGMTVVFFLVLVLGGANAATQISSCTQISQPGYYVLTADILDNTSSVCIRISTSDVVLDGQNHIVDGVFAPYSIGVYASLNLRNITVKNLNVSQWGTGIEFLNVQDGVISGNNVSSNYDSTRGYGIYIVGSASKNISITDNVLINNTASNNYGAGVYITAGTNYTIANNTITSNNNGITLQVAGSAPLSDCRIYNNTIKSSDFYGVYISSSSQADSYAHTIHDNTIDSNGYAVKVYQSYSNEVFNNTLANNNYGVYLYQSDNNTVYRNDFSNNIDIAVYQSKDDLIYLNNFASGAGGISVQDTTSVEFWNSTGLIVYSYNGQQYTSALGNYWTGYSGSDGDGNGVGDTAYPISGSNVDYKPLMQQFGSYLVLGYAPHADFTYSPANPAVVDTVIFDASPSYDRDGAVVSYAWDFGDGTTASGVTASHTYSSPGTYTVNLTVTDNDGLSSTTSKQITVTNNPPVISLVSPPDGQAFNPSTGHVELQWSAFDPDGDPVSYDLYFGNSANPPLNQTGLTVTSYNVSVSAGSTYYWKVVAKDSNGGTNASEVRSFRVMEYPSASFFYSPSAPAKTDLIIFDASSSYDPDGSIVSYSWDFGDGSSASGVTVSHIYASNGVYTVNLTVTDDDGLSDTVSKQVVIVEVSSLVITYNSTSIPETPSNYYFFYSDSDTITVDVRINTTPSLGPDSIAVSADFSYVNLSDNNILDGHNIVYNNSGKADGDYYRFTLSYSLSNVQVNTSIPVMIPIYLNISGQVRLVNYSVAIINFDPKEDIPGLNNPETTSWRNIEDFSNVTGLTFQHSSAGSVDGKLEILEPVNLLDRDFVQNLDRLGSNLIMASKAMSINNVTTAMKEFNKSSRITIYNLTTDSLVIYAIPEGSDQPVEVFNWFTGYADQSYLSGNPVVTEMSNGNYSVTFTVNHWTTYGVSETPVVNLNTNETFTTIQAAVSSPNTTDGHVIFIGNGTYDESVAVNKELTLRGESRDGVVITNKTGGDAVIRVLSDNVTVENLTVTDLPVSGIHGIGIFGEEVPLNNVSIRNVVIHNTTWSGIYAVNVNDLEIKDTAVMDTNSAQTYYGGIYLESATNPVLINVTAMRNKYVGLSAVSSYNVTIRDSKFVENCGGVMGGALFSQSDGITVMNSHFSNNTAYGLYIEDTGNVTITDSEFKSNAFSGLEIFSSGVIKSVHVTDSQLVSNGWNGLEYRETSKRTLYDLQILRNNISLNERSGIRLSGHVVGSTIRDNTIVNNGFGGKGEAGVRAIYLQNTTIANNTILNNALYGIAIFQEISASDNTISGNTISSSQYGICLTGEDNTVIDSNTVTGNTYGIYLSYSFNNVLTNNTIHANGEGITLEESPNNTIEFNTITENVADTGIYILGASEGNVIHYNNFEGNIPGIYNLNPAIQVDARYNWWNSTTGPSGDFNGKGDAAYGNISVSPWLDAPYPDGESISGEFGTVNLPAGQSNLNGSDFGLGEDEFPVEVTVNANAPVSVFGGYYSDEPSDQGMNIGNGFFYDVAINNSSAVNSLTIKISYDENALSQLGLTEDGLKAYWFDGNEWKECSDYSVNKNQNYVEIFVDATTSPSLGDMFGTPIALFASSQPSSGTSYTPSTPSGSTGGGGFAGGGYWVTPTPSPTPAPETTPAPEETPTATTTPVHTPEKAPEHTPTPETTPEQKQTPVITPVPEKTTETPSESPREQPGIPGFEALAGVLALAGAFAVLNRRK